MSYIARKRNGTGFDMPVIFKSGDRAFEVDVDIPFDVFVEAIRQFSNQIQDVSLDGTDRAIWNFFVDLDALEKFTDESYFIERCQDLYSKSSEYEDDYAEWKEERDEIDAWEQEQQKAKGS